MNNAIVCIARLEQVQLLYTYSQKSMAIEIFSPGPKWQGCFDTFCARAQKVQNKGWQPTERKSGDCVI